MGFRYDIQGLRALAVLLVFFFHLNATWLSGGFIGVDIFFVISGFLVSGIILYKKEKGTFNFVEFYIGRVKRIVPAFVFFLIFVGIVGSFVYLIMDIKKLRMNMFQAMIFNSNNYLASLNDYFGAGSQENPLLHTWTLSIEMQFYFLLPLFLILVNKKYIVPVSLFIIVILFGYSFYNSTYLNNQSAMYFSLIARIPEFLIGTVFAVKANEIKKLIGSKQNVFALLSLVGVILCGVFYTEHIVFPGLWVILPCLFAGIILVTTESKVNALFSNKILVHIGELSYSIYLWHWAIMAFIRYYYVRIDFMWYEMLSIIALTYIMSWLSYKYVENIFRMYSNKKFVFSFCFVFSFFGILGFCMPRINNQFHNMPLELVSPSFGVESHGDNFVTPDTLGNLNSSSVAMLIGDSHALSYKGFLDIIGKENDFKFISITNDSYPPIRGISRNDFKSDKDYFNYRNLVINVDKYLSSVDVIFVSITWSDFAPSLPLAFDNFMNDLPQDKKVVFISDFPILDMNPIRKSRSISKLENRYNYEVKSKEIKKDVKNIFEKYDNLLFLNLSYNNCLSQLPYLNDTVVYYDASHINYLGSKKFAGIFKKDVDLFLLENKLFNK